jgi:hypothetical protein
MAPKEPRPGRRPGAAAADRLERAISRHDSEDVSTTQAPPGAAAAQALPATLAEWIAEHEPAMSALRLTRRELRWGHWLPYIATPKQAEALEVEGQA